MSSHLTSQVWLRKFRFFSFLCLALSILSVSLPRLSFAQVDTFEFETQEQQKRFR